MVITKEIAIKYTWKEFTCFTTKKNQLNTKEGSNAVMKDKKVIRYIEN